MKDYLASVFALSVLLGVLERFLYKEKGVIGEKKAIALLLIFAVASPLPSLFSDAGSLPLFPDHSIEPGESGEYEEVALEAFEEGIKRQIAEEFSLNKDHIKVRAFGFSFEKMRAEKISVILSLSAANIDPLRIERYVNSYKIGECEVYFEVG